MRTLSFVIPVVLGYPSAIQRSILCLLFECLVDSILVVCFWEVVEQAVLEVFLCVDKEPVGFPVLNVVLLLKVFSYQFIRIYS